MPDYNAGSRFPGYDVLSKRHTPSWNEVTRRVIDARMAVQDEPKFFTTDEFATVRAIADRMVPQPNGRPPVRVAALVDHKLHLGQGDGYRHAGMPREREAWRLGLRALHAEAQGRHGKAFRELGGDEQDALLGDMQEGKLDSPAWEGMPCQTFFTQRMGRDVVYAYYSHPATWNEIGWGGPASPRGYVRMGFNERDPWEAAEAKPGQADVALRKNRHAG